MSGPPAGVEVLLQLRKQLSKHVFDKDATLAITNRDILADGAAIVVDSVSCDDTALLRDAGVYGDLILIIIILRLTNISFLPFLNPVRSTWFSRSEVRV